MLLLVLNMSMKTELSPLAIKITTFTKRQILLRDRR